MKSDAPSVELEDEPAVIAGVRAGDRAAFERVYRAFWPALVACARHSGTLSRDDAQELVQEVFLSLWRARDRLTIYQGLGRYLYGAVLNRAHRVRAARHTVVAWAFEDGAGEPTVDNSGEHRPLVHELAATVDAIVRGMPRRCRDVYRLRHGAGLDAHAVAARLGISVVTVKRHHARALHLLARNLAQTDWADALGRITRPDGRS